VKDPEGKALILAIITLTNHATSYSGLPNNSFLIATIDYCTTNDTVAGECVVPPEVPVTVMV
jgi:hypothetical protein